MEILSFVLQIAALVCLLFGGALSMLPGRIAWGWAGMFLWLLSLMTSGIILHPIR